MKPALVSLLILGAFSCSDGKGGPGGVAYQDLLSSPDYAYLLGTWKLREENPGPPIVFNARSFTLSKYPRRLSWEYQGTVMMPYDTDLSTGVPQSCVYSVSTSEFAVTNSADSRDSSKEVTMISYAEGCERYEVVRTDDPSCADAIAELNERAQARRCAANAVDRNYFPLTGALERVDENTMISTFTIQFGNGPAEEIRGTYEKSR
jgi:hypothetical protein